MSPPSSVPPAPALPSGIDESPVYSEMYEHGLLEAEFAARVEATA